MRFVCDRIMLTEALQVLQNVVGSNTTLPILSNIFIDSMDKNMLVLTSTNLEVGIQIKLDADIIEQGNCTLPGKKLYEITKEMNGAQIEIEVSSDYIGIIKSGNAIYRIMGLPAEEYPRLPRLDKVYSVKIKEDNLKSLLRKTAYAISTDETRYVLNGVYMIISKGEAIVVATDGRRLAMIKDKIDTDQNLEVGIIIPSKTVNELMRVLHGDTDIEILFSENQVGFKRERMIMVSRLIEGKFPNYDQVIPKKSKERVNINRAEFMSMVRRVSLVNDSKSNTTKLTFRNGILTLTASNPDLGEAKDDMPIDYTGEDFAIAFNPNYIVDALKILEEDEVTFEFSESTLPGVIKDGENFTYVIMPMKLR